MQAFDEQPSRLRFGITIAAGGAVLIGLVAALVGAVGYAAGSVRQSAATVSARGLSVMRRPVYLVGLGLDGLA